MLHKFFFSLELKLELPTNPQSLSSLSSTTTEQDELTQRLARLRQAEWKNNDKRMGPLLSLKHYDTIVAEELIKSACCIIIIITIIILLKALNLNLHNFEINNTHFKIIILEM